MVRLPASLRVGRLSGRRHGPGQDDSSARHARSTTRGRHRHVVVGGAALAGVQLGARGRTLYAAAQGARSQSRRTVGRRSRHGRRASGDHDLRHVATRYRAPWLAPVRLCDSRRSAGDQECGHRDGQGVSIAAGRSSARLERYADRESHRGTVEPVRVPQSGYAGCGDDIQLGHPRAGGLAAGHASGHGCVGAGVAVTRAPSGGVASHESNGGQGTAGAYRADDRSRARTQATRVLRAAAESVRHEPARSRGAGRYRQVTHAHSRSAAPIAPGGVSSGTGRPHQGLVAVGQTRCGGPGVAGNRGRGQQGAGVLAVHEFPVAAAGASRCAGSAVRVSRRPHARPSGSCGPISVGRWSAAVPHQPQGRWTRSQPHGGGVRVSARPVVESRGGSAGDRPGAPHRTNQSGDRHPGGRPGYDRVEDSRAAGQQAGTC